MLRLQLLSAEPGDVTVAPTSKPVAANAEEARLLGAVSEAASSAATAVVFKGIVGFASISIAGMIARRLSLGFVSGALLVSGVSLAAAAVIKDGEKTPV